MTASTEPEIRDQRSERPALPPKELVKPTREGLLVAMRFNVSLDVEGAQLKWPIVVGGGDMA